MSTNVIVFGWKRSVPGREALSAKHFEEFIQFLQAQVKQGTVESFEPILLEPNGGDLSGFFLIKGEGLKLGELTHSTGWAQHQVRATLHMEGIAILRGLAGSAVQQRMRMWSDAIPRS
jgi:hypothetical protein